MMFNSDNLKKNTEEQQQQQKCYLTIQIYYYSLPFTFVYRQQKNYSSSISSSPMRYINIWIPRCQAGHTYATESIGDLGKWNDLVNI